MFARRVVFGEWLLWVRFCFCGHRQTIHCPVLSAPSRLVFFSCISIFISRLIVLYDTAGLSAISFADMVGIAFIISKTATCRSLGFRFTVSSTGFTVSFSPFTVSSTLFTVSHVVNPIDRTCREACSVVGGMRKKHMLSSHRGTPVFLGSHVVFLTSNVGFSTSELENPTSELEFSASHAFVGGGQAETSAARRVCRCRDVATPQWHTNPSMWLRVRPAECRDVLE